MELRYVRNGQENSLVVKPELTDQEGKPAYKIGVVCSSPMVVEHLAVGAAFQRSVEQNKKNSVLIIEIVKRLLTKKASIKQMSGPISIARQFLSRNEAVGFFERDPINRKREADYTIGRKNDASDRPSLNIVGR